MRGSSSFGLSLEHAVGSSKTVEVHGSAQMGVIAFSEVSSSCWPSWISILLWRSEKISETLWEDLRSTTHLRNALLLSAKISAEWSRAWNQSAHGQSATAWGPREGNMDVRRGSGGSTTTCQPQSYYLAEHFSGKMGALELRTYHCHSRSNHINLTSWQTCTRIQEADNVKDIAVNLGQRTWKSGWLTQQIWEECFNTEGPDPH